MTEPSDTLTVYVDEREYEVPADFGSSPVELLREIGLDPDLYDLYWDTGRTHPHKADKCAEPLVVDDGSMFRAVSTSDFTGSGKWRDETREQ